MCQCQTEKFDVQDLVQGKHEDDLIEILHQVQAKWGYIPKEAASDIALALNIPLSTIYGVTTFYSAFSLVPKGGYAISVCMGTACYVKGAEALLKEVSDLLHIGVGETTEDLLFSLVETRCVGECADAPVVTINDKVYKNVTVGDIRTILSEIGDHHEAL